MSSDRDLEMCRHLNDDMYAHRKQVNEHNWALFNVVRTKYNVNFGFDEHLLNNISNTKMAANLVRTVHIKPLI